MSKKPPKLQLEGCVPGPPHLGGFVRLGDIPKVLEGLTIYYKAMLTWYDAMIEKAQREDKPESQDSWTRARSQFKSCGFYKTAMEFFLDLSVEAKATRRLHEFRGILNR